MERNITIEQLQELSSDQKERIREWWFGSPPGFSDVYFVLRKYDDGLQYEGPHLNDGNRNFIEDFNVGEALPLLKIGQLIQLLQELTTTLGAVWKIDWNWYDYNVAVQTIRDNEVMVDVSEKELCDSLWKAIKKLL